MQDGHHDRASILHQIEHPKRKAAHESAVGTAVDGLEQVGTLGNQRKGAGDELQASQPPADIR